MVFAIRLHKALAHPPSSSEVQFCVWVSTLAFKIIKIQTHISNLALKMEMASLNGRAEFH